MIDLQNFKQKSIGHSVLHVDTSHKFLENSLALFQKLFETAYISDNPLNALENFKKYAYEILITDIEFADIDGIEFIKEVKELSPKTVIIIVSSHYTKENLLELSSLGLFKLLEKPIKVPNLVETLYEALLAIEAQKKSSLPQEELEEKNSLIEQIKIFQQTQNPIQLHNYYKGLSITNNATIKDVGTNHITFVTNNMQQKVIQYEMKTIVSSDLLTSTLVCKNILKIEFNSGTVSFMDFTLQETSPISRKAMRVLIESPHTVNLSVNEHLFHGEISITDLSVDAVKLKLDALPAGIHTTSNSIKIDINIQNGEETVVLNTDAKYLREDENDSSYSIVFMLSYEAAQKSPLVKYLAKRQMELIREFKRL